MNNSSDKAIKINSNVPEFRQTYQHFNINFFYIALAEECFWQIEDSEKTVIFKGVFDECKAFLRGLEYLRVKSQGFVDCLEIYS